MGPKVEAICRFAESGGSVAAIGALTDASAVLDGQVGTSIRSRGMAKGSVLVCRRQPPAEHDLVAISEDESSTAPKVTDRILARVVTFDPGAAPDVGRT